jgi:hypothetical protein
MYILLAAAKTAISRPMLAFLNEKPREAKSGDDSLRQCPRISDWIISFSVSGG